MRVFVIVIELIISCFFYVTIKKFFHFIAANSLKLTVIYNFDFDGTIEIFSSHDGNSA